jgi:hypothetical protein
MNMFDPTKGLFRRIFRTKGQFIGSSGPLPAAQASKVQNTGTVRTLPVGSMWTTRYALVTP